MTYAACVREVALILLAVAAVAAPSFCLPIRGDEASYLTAAEAVAGGAALYRDTWDVTNPGVFAWYALAGSLFGFTEDGVRLLDLLWQAAFALTLSAAVRRAYALPRLPVAPGVLVAGAYFLAGYSTAGHLARAEGLAVFPLFVAVTGVAVGGRRWLLAAGVAAGAVALLKLMLAGVVVAGWLVLLVLAVRGRRPVLRPMLWLLAGLAVPVGAAVGYFAAHGALGEAGRTLFVVPRQMMAEVPPAGLDRLLTALKWFAGVFAGPAAVAVVGASCRWPARDPFLPAWLAALAAAVAVVLAQRLSWWPYHWMLPGGMLAVLAGYTLPAIRATGDGAQLPRGVWPLAAAAGLAPLMLAGGVATVHAAGHRFGLTAADRAAARLSYGTTYREAAAEADWLAEPGRKPGAILVGGDPLVQRFGGRRPAVRALGWSLELWPAAVRAGVEADVRERRPAYVFLSRPYGYVQLVADRYPGLAALLARDYRPVRDTWYGVWYERID